MENGLCYGVNEEGEINGDPPARVKLHVLILDGCLAGVAGLFWGSRAMSARPLMSTGYLMPAMLPTMGGASLNGGGRSCSKNIVGSIFAEYHH